MYCLLQNLYEDRSTGKKLLTLAPSYYKCANIIEIAKEETNACHDAKDSNIDEEDGKATFVLTGPFDVEVLLDGAFSIPHIFLHYLSFFVFLQARGIVHSLWIIKYEGGSLSRK